MLHRVRHVTTYRYEEPVSLSLNLARLRPRDDLGQRVIAAKVIVNPTPTVQHQRRDSFANHLDVFTIQTAHRELEVSATCEVERDPSPPPDPAHSAPWTAVRDQLLGGGPPSDLHGFRFESPYVPIGPAFADFAAPSFTPDRTVLHGALDLAQRIRDTFAYDPRATSVATPVADVLARRRGVCQDFAHLMLAGLRSIGLGARYVSGYLETDPPPGREKLRGADATHAWIAVWCPVLGWCGLDPTNGSQVGNRHLILAHGRDFHDASPLKGVVMGGGHHMVEVSVDVECVD